MSRNQSIVVEQRDAWMPIHKSKRAASADQATRAEWLQTTGRRMVVAGFVITILGVVAYCGVTFAGGVNAEVGDLLFRNAVPFGRSTLVVLGIGTLVWLIGSFTYLRGAMEADDDPGEGGSPDAE